MLTCGQILLLLDPESCWPGSHVPKTQKGGDPISFGGPSPPMALVTHIALALPAFLDKYQIGTGRGSLVDQDYMFCEVVWLVKNLYQTL